MGARRLGLRNTLLIRAFGRPEGLIGWIGGRLMTRGKAECGRSLIDMLDLQSESSVLEIGCGPGVLLSLFAEAIPRGRVVGVDPSPTMLHQARRRNPDTVNRGQIELLLGEAESLPLGDSSFDVAVTLNSMQLWNDIGLGLQECRRVLRPCGRICIGFTPEAGQPDDRPDTLLRNAGFANVIAQQGTGATWTFARKP